MGRLQDITKRVKRNLGYPIVTIELDDSEIVELIKDSIYDLNTYSSEYAIETLPLNNSSLDLTKYPQIYKIIGTIDSRSSGNIGTQPSNSIFYPNQYSTNPQVYNVTSRTCQGTQYGMKEVVNRVMINRAYNKLINSVTEPTPSWRMNGDICYFSPNISTVTVEYIVRWDPDNLILSDEWTRIITRHATNSLKMVLGTARRKYKSNKALFELDTEILKEGMDDQENLIKELEEGILNYSDFL